MIKTLFNPFMSRLFGNFSGKLKRIFFFAFCFLLFTFRFLQAQDTLEVIVTWEQPEEVEFRCTNSNSSGSDLNNDGYDDFIHFSYNNATGERKFQFYFGSSNPGTEPDLEISTDLPVNFDPSWGGDLNSDGYKDIVFSVQTDWGDPGDIYICLGGEEIDLEPELILHGEDYAPDPYHLCFKGINGGYDFNGDGYNDILAGGIGDDYTWRGMVAIFFGGEELDAEADFHLLGNNVNELGKYKTAGDINGDGFDDLIISRNIEPELNSPIKFEIYLGGPDMDTIMDYEIPEVWVDVFEILACSDINNDNFNDLLITGSLDGISGLIGFYYGCSNLELTLTSYNALPNGGFSYINFNNDEYKDLVATYKYEGIGYINVFLGSNNVDFVPDFSIQFGNFNLQYGKIGCNLGDFNGDGEDDILVNDGIPYNSATMYGLSDSNSVYNNQIPMSNFKLSNYPNPFNPETIISFSIPKESKVELTVYNIKGQKVKTLSNDDFEKGFHKLIWNGKDSSGKEVGSGIYFYKLKVNEKDKSVKKCLLLK